MPRLTDPWFEPAFYGKATPGGGFTLQGAEIDGAQGLSLWCPCGFQLPRYRTDDGGRPHWLLVPFANPRNAPELPADHGPLRTGQPDAPRPRWQMSGTGLHDLTVHPSVAVGSPECWHGWIQNGEVT